MLVTNKRYDFLNRAFGLNEGTWLPIAVCIGIKKLKLAVVF